MFPSVRKCVYARRRGLALTAGVLGSAYLLGRYVVARLEEIRDKVLQDRAARDNLRRRFAKNQEDVAFSVLALLQPLGAAILDAMDVERLTADLRALSARPAVAAAAAVDEDARSTATDDSGSGSRLAESASSWVDQFSQSQSQASLPGYTVSAGHDDSPRSTDASASLASSMLSDTTSESEASSSSTKSKAELWREVKLLAFTRTLTVAYAGTLLALLAHAQLSILGRHKYIASVRALARESASRDAALFDAAALFSDFALPGQREDRDDDGEEDEEEVTDELERTYLTISWWLLNEGWREVASRVQRAVEDVFEPVSLKTQLSIDDLSQLIQSVRARIQISDNFLPALLPPTPTQLARVLPPSTPSLASPLLGTLLDETRSRLRSADFALVLRAALARAEAVLLAALEDDLFKPDPLPPQEDLEASFGPRIREIPTKRVRLAALLPGVARWAHAAVQGYPNELVDGVARLHEVEVFCAIVYSAYDDELLASS